MRYAGTVWSAMMVPIQALRWYRYKRYDGTVSPILSIYRYNTERLENKSMSNHELVSSEYLKRGAWRTLTTISSSRSINKPPTKYFYLVSGYLYNLGVAIFQVLP